MRSAAPARRKTKGGHSPITMTQSGLGGLIPCVRERHPNSRAKLWFSKLWFSIALQPRRLPPVQIPSQRYASAAAICGMPYPIDIQRVISFNS